MSEVKQKILNLLADSTSKNPIAQTDLSAKSKLPSEILNKQLDELYASNLIAQCTITRNGKTGTVYWQTGCVKGLIYGEHHSNQTNTKLAEKVPERYCTPCKQTHPPSEFDTVRGSRCRKSALEARNASQEKYRAQHKTKKGGQLEPIP
jgi:hypothetical protein